MPPAKPAPAKPKGARRSGGFTELMARSATRQAAGVFVLALAVRAVHLLAMRDSPLYEVLNGDAWQYDQWAQRIAGGEWIGTEAFYQTPLYPYLLAVLYRIVGHQVWAVRIIQAVAGSVACVFMARGASRVFSDKVGWISGLLLALYPPAIFFDGLLQKSSLDLLLMTALVWVIAEAQLAVRPWLLALAGALVGAMTLNRENAAALLPVLLAWIAWLSWPELARQGLARGGAFVLGAALVLVPVGLRNYYVGGTFLLTTSQMGPNFYIGNRTGSLGTYSPLRASRGDPRFERYDARQLAEADLKRPLSASEVSDYWMDRTIAEIRLEPSSWLRLMVWKWFLTWNAAELVDTDALHTHQRHSRLLELLGWILHFGILCPLAVLGLWWTRRDWRRLWVFYAIALAFAAGVTLFYVFARYRFPLVPLAALFAGAGVSGLWDRLTRRDYGSQAELAIAFLPAVAAAVACNWPFAPPFNEDAVTYYSAATLMLDEGRAGDALALFRQAEQSDPNFPETHNELGVLLLSRGDIAAAQKETERAVELSPNNALFRANRAVVLAKSGHRDAAIDELRRAIELDAMLASAYQPLGELELARGEKTRAVEHLQRAVELNPGSAPARAALGIALQASGRSAEAVAALRVSLAADDSNLAAVNSLAWLLATSPLDALRNGAEAVQLAERACQQTRYQQPQLLDTLAAAYAETGQFDRAQQTVEQALRAAGDKQAELTKIIESRRKIYRQGQPYRDTRFTDPASAAP